MRHGPCGTRSGGVSSSWIVALQAALPSNGQAVRAADPLHVRGDARQLAPLHERRERLEGVPLLVDDERELRRGAGVVGLAVELLGERLGVTQKHVASIAGEPAGVR